MKRIVSFVAVVLIFFSCYVNCYAAEYEETYMGNVYAKINYSSDSKVYTATPIRGQYALTTDDGIQITVDSNNLDLVLVVHQITEKEKEAYEWFKSCMPQSVIRFIPYDIYFLNASGDRIELSSEDAITISIYKSTQYVVGLSCDGNLIDISYSINNYNVTFKASSSSNYYVLCEALGSVKSPQTGITSDSYLLIMLFMSLLNLLLVTRRRQFHKVKA